MATCTCIGAHRCLACKRQDEEAYLAASAARRSARCDHAALVADDVAWRAGTTECGRVDDGEGGELELGTCKRCKSTISRPVIGGGQRRPDPVPADGARSRGGCVVTFLESPSTRRAS